MSINYGDYLEDQGNSSISGKTWDTIEELQSRPTKPLVLGASTSPAEVHKPVSSSEKYKLIVRDALQNDKLVFAAEVGKDVLSVLPHFVRLMETSMREQIEKKIVLTLAGVTKEAVTFYLRYLQWRKNGCTLPLPDALKEKVDPSGMILAHYLGDTLFLEGFIVITDSNRTLACTTLRLYPFDTFIRRDFDDEDDKPVCDAAINHEITLTKGIYTETELISVITAQLNTSCDYEYKVTFDQESHLCISAVKHEEILSSVPAAAWDRLDSASSVAHSHLSRLPNPKGNLIPSGPAVDQLDLCRR